VSDRTAPQARNRLGVLQLLYLLTCHRTSATAAYVDKSCTMMGYVTAMLCMCRAFRAVASELVAEPWLLED
jgi:hypothetical protein